MQEVVPGQKPGSTQSSSARKDSWRRGVEAYLGPSALKGQVGVGLGMRKPIGKKLILEWGAVLPHPVAGYAGDSAIATDSIATEYQTAHLHSFSEIHGALLLRLRETARWSFDAGAGLSLGILGNRITRIRVWPPQPDQISSDDSVAVRPAPRLQMGGRVALTRNISLALQAAWVHYANTESRGAQKFDLGFNGVLIEPALQWRF